MKCEKCGHEIAENSPICMYCGAAASKGSGETASKVQVPTGDGKSSSVDGASLKAFGALLLIAGIIADIISMFWIPSGSVTVFRNILIFGSISSVIGLALVRIT